MRELLLLLVFCLPARDVVQMRGGHGHGGHGHSAFPTDQRVT